MRNSHLFISVLIVIPVAFVYGFQPDFLFEIDPKTIDENNFLKAVMGLYLSFSLIWILGIFNPNLWKLATISNMLFMFGLGIGRIISLLFDGNPSPLFIFGTVGELVLGMYSFFQLQKFKDSL